MPNVHYTCRRSLRELLMGLQHLHLAPCTARQQGQRQMTARHHQLGTRAANLKIQSRLPKPKRPSPGEASCGSMTAHWQRLLEAMHGLCAPPARWQSTRSLLQYPCRVGADGGAALTAVTTWHSARLCCTAVCRAAVCVLRVTPAACRLPQQLKSGLPTWEARRSDLQQQGKRFANNMFSKWQATMQQPTKPVTKPSEKPN